MPFESREAADCMRFAPGKKGGDFNGPPLGVARMRQPLLARTVSMEQRQGGVTDRLDFRTYQAVTERHDHAFWQVVLPVEGRLDIEIEGRAGQVAGAQGALIPPGHLHAFEARAANRFLVADVESLPLGDRLAGAFSRRAFFAVSPAVRALVDYRSRVPLEGDAIGPWCALLLAALGGAAEADAGLAEDAGTEARAVRRARAYMEAHLADGITIAMLCRETGLAAHRLTRAFRRIEGESPYAWLTGLRVRRAEDLLRQSDLPLAEIAARTGFADQSAMTRHMRRLGLESPAAFRRTRRLS